MVELRYRPVYIVGTREHAGGFLSCTYQETETNQEMTVAGRTPGPLGSWARSSEGGRRGESLELARASRLRGEPRRLFLRRGVPDRRPTG
jgi:hypothetical protein